MKAIVEESSDNSFFFHNKKNLEATQMSIKCRMDDISILWDSMKKGEEEEKSTGICRRTM